MALSTSDGPDSHSLGETLQEISDKNRAAPLPLKVTTTAENLVLRARRDGRINCIDSPAKIASEQLDQH